MEMWLLTAAATILVLLTLWVVSLPAEAPAWSDQLEEETDDMPADDDPRAIDLRYEVPSRAVAPALVPVATPIAHASEPQWVWWRDRVVVGGLAAMAGLAVGAA